MNVQRTTVVVALGPVALTPWAAIHVPRAVLRDTKETGNVVEVRQLNRFCSAVKIYYYNYILFT